MQVYNRFLPKTKRFFNISGHFNNFLKWFFHKFYGYDRSDNLDEYLKENITTPFFHWFYEIVLTGFLFTISIFTILKFCFKIPIPSPKVYPAIVLAVGVAYWGFIRTIKDIRNAR